MTSGVSKTALLSALLCAKPFNLLTHAPYQGQGFLGDLNDIEDILLGFVGQNIVLLLLAALIIISVLLGVRIVPQSMKFVVERFGRLRSVLGPGINFIVPFLDRVGAPNLNSGTSAADPFAGCNHG